MGQHASKVRVSLGSDERHKNLLIFCASYTTTDCLKGSEGPAHHKP